MDLCLLLCELKIITISREDPSSRLSTVPAVETIHLRGKCGESSFFLLVGDAKLV